MRGDRDPIEKKGASDTHQFKKGLHFEAETPNFLKVLQNAQRPAHASLRGNREDDDDDDDGEGRARDADHDDEAPQVVLGKNVSDSDAVKALGLKDAASLQVTEKGGSYTGKKRSNTVAGDKEAAREAASTSAPSSKIVEIGTSTSASQKRRKRMEELKTKSGGPFESIDAGKAKQKDQKAEKKGAANYKKKLLSFDFDNE